MAFQAAPTTGANNRPSQSMAQPIVSSGVTPAPGTWQAAPRPQAVNQPTVGYPIG